MSHEAIPPEVLSLVFSRLPPRSLAQAAQTCGQWRGVADSLYKQLIARYFRKFYNSCDKDYGRNFSEADWKNEFIRLYQLSRSNLPETIAKLFMAVRAEDPVKLECVIQEILKQKSGFQLLDLRRRDALEHVTVLTYASGIGFHQGCDMIFSRLIVPTYPSNRDLLQWAIRTYRPMKHVISLFDENHTDSITLNLSLRSAYASRNNEAIDFFLGQGATLDLVVINHYDAFGRWTDSIRLEQVNIDPNLNDAQRRELLAEVENLDCVFLNIHQYFPVDAPAMPHVVRVIDPAGQIIIERDNRMRY